MEIPVVDWLAADLQVYDNDAKENAPVLSIQVQALYLTKKQQYIFQSDREHSRELILVNMNTIINKQIWVKIMDF